jgi:3-oxoadipate enol-lactonase
MGTVRVGSVDVAFAVDGSGPPLVLCHGTTSDRSSWQAQVVALSSNFTLIRPEYPGSGETVDHASSEPLQLDDLVAQVVGVCDSLGHKQFHVGGWSLGGVVATAVAAAHPDRVLSLTAVAGWVTSDARIRLTMDLWEQLIATDPRLFARYAMVDGMSATMQAMIEPMADMVIDTMAPNIAPGSARQIDLDRRIDLSGQLAKITAPTLVVGGTDDRWIGIDHQRALAAGIDGARLVELDCGHLLPQEQTEALNDLIVAHVGAN